MLQAYKLVASVPVGINSPKIHAPTSYCYSNK
jgi:hypothetical protein